MEVNNFQRLSLALMFDLSPELKMWVRACIDVGADCHPARFHATA
jgi:hypothetical protein